MDIHLDNVGVVLHQQDTMDRDGALGGRRAIGRAEHPQAAQRDALGVLGAWHHLHPVLPRCGLFGMGKAEHQAFAGSKRMGGVDLQLATPAQLLCGSVTIGAVRVADVQTELCPVARKK